MDVVALAQKLIAFNTVNPPGNEAECARYIGHLLEKAGFRVREFAFAPGRPSLVAVKPGTDNLKPICFSGHLDTVPLGARPWSHDPLSGTVVEGRLFGRGSTDMKAGVAAMVTAVDRCRNDPPAPRGIMLVLTSGEEMWCQGAYHLASLPDPVLPPTELLVIGEPSDNEVLIGHKGALWIEISAQGRAAHGAMPDQGQNAIYKAAEIIQRLQKMNIESGASHPLLGRPSLNVGTIQGGQNTNSVPDTAVLTVDIRTLPGQSGLKIVDGIKDLIGDLGRVRVLTDVPGVATPADHPWVGRILGIAGEVRGASLTAAGVPYFTDAAALVPAMGNPPMIILGPGNPRLAHQTDENCSIAAIHEAVEIYLKIIRTDMVIADELEGRLK